MATRKKAPRNTELSLVAKNDPTRLRTRTVMPEKGHGKKTRPRNSNRSKKIVGEC